MLLSVVDATGLPEVEEWLKSGLEVDGKKLHRVGRAARAADVVREASRHKPDLILLSTGLADTNELKALLPELHGAVPDSRVILLHGRANRSTGELVTEAVLNGYYDFAGPFATATDILDLIEHPRTYEQARDNPLVLQELLPAPEPVQEAPEEPLPESAPAQQEATPGTFSIPEAPEEPPGPMAGADLYERLQAEGVRMRSTRQPRWTAPEVTAAAPAARRGGGWALPLAVALILSLAGNAYLYTFYPKYQALHQAQLTAAAEAAAAQQGHSIPMVVGQVVTVGLPLTGGTQAPRHLSRTGWTNPNNLAQTVSLSIQDLLANHPTRFSNFLGYTVGAKPPSWEQDYVASVFPQLASAGPLTAQPTKLSAMVLTHGPTWALLGVMVQADVAAGGKVVKRGAAFGLGIGLMRGPNGWVIEMLRLMPGAMLQGMAKGAS